MSFWIKQAQSDHYLPQPSLVGAHKSDIVIVGGGFTGLWTAIMLKQAEPHLNISIVESRYCGSGASGRNGGCMLTFATKFPSLIKYYGLEEAIRLVKASEQAAFDIENFCQQWGIEADIRLHGAMYFASNPKQVGALDASLALLEQHGLNHWQAISLDKAKSLSATNQVYEAYYSDYAGSLQPAKLVNGLKKVALTLGVEIFEHSAMKRMDKTSVHCESGSIHADKVILATGIHAARQFSAFRRSMMLVSSDMVISQEGKSPVDRGTALIDNNTFVHYFRSTPDGRLMLGKGGNRISFGNHYQAGFDQASEIQSSLQQRYQAFFQQDMALDMSWCGASDRTVSGLPFFGTHQGIYYGLGFSGNGVLQTHLAGKFLTSLVLEKDDVWRRSKMAQGPLGYFPMEPVRYLGAQMVKGAIRRQERHHDQNQSAPGWINSLAGLAGAAGKADK